MNKIKLAGFTLLFITFVYTVYISTLFLTEEKSEKVSLKVMTYPSFLSPYGPGTELKKIFEKTCNCKVRWLQVEDSTLISQRLSLRADGLGVDVALGLDQLTLLSTFKDREWLEIPISMHKFTSKSRKWVRKKAIPISWSPLTFLFRDLSSNQSTSLVRDISFLLDPVWKNSITLPHPKNSTVGLQFYFWIYSIFTSDERIAFLKNLKSQIYTITDSWSSSYGLFQRGFAQISFSYQTSLIYHFLDKKKKNHNHNYNYFSFKEGHPYQVEYAAIPKTSKQYKLALKFINFLLSSEAQSILMRKNYMLPVAPGIVAHTSFEKLESLKLISYKKLNSFLSKKDKMLKDWDNILSR